jgi:hypothetical protein
VESIPLAAWGLMMGIAIFSNLFVGYATRRSRSEDLVLLVAPVIVSISFLLISYLGQPTRRRYQGSTCRSHKPGTSVATVTPLVGSAIDQNDLTHALLSATKAVIFRSG